MNIEELINSYGMYIYNYALKLSCHPDIAQDLCQETFINAWRKIDTLGSPDACKAWLRKICFNNFLMYERKKDNKLKKLSNDEIKNLEADGEFYMSSCEEPEDEIIVSESVKELQNGCFLAMVRYLTLNQRIVFSLTCMFGLSLDEVSELLNISKGAVKGLLYRAHMNIDSFFYNHCSIINVKNPCRCEAWIEFYKSREDLQIKVQKIKLLNYKKSNYIFDKNVYSKVKYLYENMPDKKPSAYWYENVINSLRS